MDLSPLLCTLFHFVPSSRKELEAIGEWPSKEKGYSVDFGDRAGMDGSGRGQLPVHSGTLLLPLPALGSTVLCFSVMTQPLEWGGVLCVCVCVCVRRYIYMYVSTCVDARISIALHLYSSRQKLSLNL